MLLAASNKYAVLVVLQGWMPEAKMARSGT